MPVTSGSFNEDKRKRQDPKARRPLFSWCLSIITTSARYGPVVVVMEVEEALLLCCRGSSEGVVVTGQVKRMVSDERRCCWL